MTIQSECLEHISLIRSAPIHVWSHLDGIFPHVYVDQMT